MRRNHIDRPITDRTAPAGLAQSASGVHCAGNLHGAGNLKLRGNQARDSKTVVGERDGLTIVDFVVSLLGKKILSSGRTQGEN